MAVSYPVGAIVSMVVSGRLYDRLSDQGRLRMFIGQHALAVACLQLLCMAPSSGVLTMACMTGTMMGVAPTIFLAPSALVTRYAETAKTSRTLAVVSLH
jgi:predicted MFS family arabinose efflux permease